MCSRQVLSLQSCRPTLTGARLNPASFFFSCKVGTEDGPSLRRRWLHKKKKVGTEDGPSLAEAGAEGEAAAPPGQTMVELALEAYQQTKAELALAELAGAGLSLSLFLSGHVTCSLSLSLSLSHTHTVTLTDFFFLLVFLLILSHGG